MNIFRFLLYPVALIYEVIIRIRNLLFDLKILPSEQFPFPVIAVGNLSAGGMGKTPMVEYLIRMFRQNLKVATLSRGYKRKTRGFRIAGPDDTPLTIGDEPMQFHKKFSDVTVAVDEHRRRGIKLLLKSDPGIQMVILDDAFQHRYVRPGLSILVTDYQKMFSKDYMLPVGTLREPASSCKRADIIVVTKTPRGFSPILRRQLLEELNVTESIPVCFAYIGYDDLVPLFCREICGKVKTDDLFYILMFTGIANPYPMKEYLKSLCTDLEVIEFPDHVNYTEQHLKKIRDTYDRFPSRRKAIVTTEKDASKLRTETGRKYLGDLPVFYLPMHMKLHAKDEVVFRDTLMRRIQQYYPKLDKSQS